MSATTWVLLFGGLVLLLHFPLAAAQRRLRTLVLLEEMLDGGAYEAGPLRRANLRLYTAISRSSFASIIGRLEAAGLVRRFDGDPADGSEKRRGVWRGPPWLALNEARREEVLAQLAEAPWWTPKGATP